MSELDLETEFGLMGVKVGPDGVNIIGGNWYVCPECGDGHITHYGGNVYLCGECDYQH
jgi:ribosomal protein S27AE